MCSYLSREKGQPQGIIIISNNASAIIGYTKLCSSRSHNKVILYIAAMAGDAGVHITLELDRCMFNGSLVCEVKYKKVKSYAMASN